MSAGNGVVVKNLAKYSGGSWTPVNTKWTVRGRIVAMTAYSTSLFYAPSVNIEAGDPLPFDVIDTITGNSTLSSMFAYIPTCYSALSIRILKIAGSKQALRVIRKGIKEHILYISLLQRTKGIRHLRNEVTALQTVRMGRFGHT